MDRPLYSIVISFYNEESQADFVIKRLLDNLNAKRIDFELILVNNGSCDRTEEILQSFAQRDQRVRSISLEENIGFGGGTLTGLELARGEFIGFEAAGGQVLPEHIRKVFDTARENPKAVVKAKRMTRESAWRSLMAWGYALVVNALFFVRTSDIDGRPLALAKDVFDSFSIKSKNLMLNLEILTKARKRGLRIIQVPVPYYKRVGGKSHTTFATAVLFLKQLIEFRRDSFFRG